MSSDCCCDGYFDGPCTCEEGGPVQLKPTAACPSWPEHSLMERLNMCRQMLYFHGVLPAGENEKVMMRIAKMEKKGEGL